ASWMGGDTVLPGATCLNQSGIFTLPYPDAAARVFTLMAKYSDNLRALYETPRLTIPPSRALNTISSLLDNAKAQQRTLLSEWESKQLLDAYGIPTIATQLATSADEAVEIAEDIGYPVVLKLHSHTITHKTDVGGVKLDLCDEAAVRSAFKSISSIGDSGDCLGVTVQPMVNLQGYELIVGSTVDAQFGPVLLFGNGGQLVEVYRDLALGLPPLNTTLARRLMEKTRVYSALKGVRGQSGVDMGAIERLLVQFSQLVLQYPEIKDVEINPLLASADRLLALDARVVLHDSELPFEQLPKPAIRPYPSQYIKPWTMKNGMATIIRPIGPEDEPSIVSFHHNLSEESVYFRYFHMIKLQARVAHERLTRICFIDYDREMALVAEHADPETGDRSILGVARLSQLHDRNEAEFGMLIADAYQGQGLGTEFLKSLLNIARCEGISRISATLLPANHCMQHICRTLGFTIERSLEEVNVYMNLE
ncbi:MAG: GNAT family N-acetyltransferase, partial [Cyanobacteria bacterium P01_E01_bin.34]